MKRSPRRPVLHVNFGEPEDFLSSSIFKDISNIPIEAKEKQQEIYTRVVTALRRDDLTILNGILAEIPDLVDDYLERPLAHMAAEHGGLKILQRLVGKMRGSVNSVSEDGNATTPLFWAIKEGHTEVVDWLLCNGAHHAPLNACHDNAVYVAVYYNQIKLLDTLQAHRCSCNIPNKYGDLPLKHVIRVSNFSALERLSQMEVDIYGWDSRENFRCTLLSDALMCQKPPYISPVLQCLLDKPSVNAFSNQPMIHQLLLLVIWKDDAKAVALLLKYLNPLEEGIDVIFQTLQQECLSLPHMNCLKELVKYNGVSLTRAGKYPAHIFRIFLENDPRVILQKDIVRQCLQYSSTRLIPRYGSDNENVIAKFQMLMDNGYEMNKSSTDPSGSPVFQVTKEFIPCVLLWLLRIGSDVTSPCEGKTPLAQALEPFRKDRSIYVGQLEVAILLIEYLPTYNDPLCKVVEEFLDHGRDFCVPCTGVGLCGMLKERSTNPRPLQHLTRIIILRALGTRSFKGVHKLGLPTRMVEYVMLHDLEELVKVMQRNEP